MLTAAIRGDAKHAGAIRLIARVPVTRIIKTKRAASEIKAGIIIENHRQRDRRQRVPPSRTSRTLRHASYARGTRRMLDDNRRGIDYY